MKAILGSTAVLRRLFCQLKPIEGALVAQRKEPVHLRPYDPLKYEVPAKRIKRHSGYSTLQVQPMPRATIMKLGYNFLARMKEAPEGVYYRIFNEERTKWIMKIVDQTEDIQQLEKILGVDSIEVFIMLYMEEFKNIDFWLKLKPWEDSIDEHPLDFMDKAKLEKDLAKNPRYNRPSRSETQFLQ